MSLMGIDIGSSRCKAVVFAESGQILAEAMRSYEPSYPGRAMVEMEPSIFWDAVCAVSTEAALKVSLPVHALSICTHGETFVPVDSNGDPDGPAIMNSDNRATAEAEEWERRLGRETLYGITGLVAHPMFPISKIEWLRRNEPERFRAVDKYVSVGGYILMKMGLPPYVDYSLASRYMAFDVRKRCWSADILNAADISMDCLPEVVPAETIAGKLNRSAAAELGLPAGTVVAVGGHDQPCGALGVGAIESGMVADSLGTYECLLAVTDEPCLNTASLSSRLNSYCHVVPDKYATLAFFPGGVMVKWCCDMLCSQDLADADAVGINYYSYLESKLPDGPTGLCITPHLIGAYNPHWDAQASGVIVGINPTTSRYHLYKGVLEGLACELALNADVLAEAAVSFNEIRSYGGGANSKRGLQLRASMTGRTVLTFDNPEAVCLGAAILAGVGDGTYSSFDEAVAQVVHSTGALHPDTAQSDAYSGQLGRYRMLYPALARVFHAE